LYDLRAEPALSEASLQKIEAALSFDGQPWSSLDDDASGDDFSDDDSSEDDSSEDTSEGYDEDEQSGPIPV